MAVLKLGSSIHLNNCCCSNTKLLFNPISLKTYIDECCWMNWNRWAVCLTWTNNPNQNCFHFLTRIHLVLKHRATRITLKVSNFSIEKINEHFLNHFFASVNGCIFENLLKAFSRFLMCTTISRLHLCLWVIHRFFFFLLLVPTCILGMT